MHDIEYVDDLKCELASLYSAYKSLLEESVKIKIDSIKLHNRALKVNELDNSLNTEKVNKIKFVECEHENVIEKNKYISLEFKKKMRKDFGSKNEMFHQRTNDEITSKVKFTKDKTGLDYVNKDIYETSSGKTNFLKA